MSHAWPRGVYYVIVSRRRRRPRADVYAWALRQHLPQGPIPLKDGDPDAILDLQAVSSTVYHRARYHLSIDYKQPLNPPLSEADSAWARQILEA